MNSAQRAIEANVGACELVKRWNGNTVKTLHAARFIPLTRRILTPCYRATVLPYPACSARSHPHAL